MLALANTSWLDDLAADLTRALGIPFCSDGSAVSFVGPLRITDWSVPLIFDGHAGRQDNDLVPLDFVGHVLWAALDAVTRPGDIRPTWSCQLTPAAAQAILEELDNGEPLLR